MGCPLGRAVWPVRRVITCTLGPLLRRILGTFLAVLRSLSIVGLEARGADHCRSPVSDRSYSRKLLLDLSFVGHLTPLDRGSQPGRRQSRGFGDQEERARLSTLLNATAAGSFPC